MDLKYCVEVPTDLVQQETQTDLETEFPSTLATKCCESKNSCTSSTNTAASLDGATFIGGAVDVSTEVNFKDVYGSAFFCSVCFKPSDNMVGIESDTSLSPGLCDHRLCLPCGLGIVKTAVNLQRTPECPFCKRNIKSFKIFEKSQELVSLSNEWKMVEDTLSDMGTQCHVIAVDEQGITNMKNHTEHSAAMEHWESLRWTKTCIWMEYQNGKWSLIDSWSLPTGFLGRLTGGDNELKIDLMQVAVVEAFSQKKI